jgi:hypothetical protein
MKPILKKQFKKNNWIYVFFLFGLCFLFFVLAFDFQYKSVNNKKYKESKTVSEPIFSITSGTYRSNQPILITLDNSADNIVRYTTDGSEPTSESKEYTSPIQLADLLNYTEELSKIPTSPRWKMPIRGIERCAIIRAKTFNTKQALMSRAVCQTYFFEDINRKITLPIISIVTDKDNLFDYEKGIYILGKKYNEKKNYITSKKPLDQGWWRYPANYHTTGKKSYRPADFIYFEKGKSKFSFIGRLKISGQATRAFSQKSIIVTVDDAQNQNHINYQLFEDDTLNKYFDFVIRNAGNDWGKGMMRDAVIETLLKKSSYLAPAYKPVVVFINGEYWGIHLLSQRLNEKYFSAKYNISTDKVLISRAVFFEEKNNPRLPQEMINLTTFLHKNDMTKIESYRYVDSLIDIDNYLDYVIAEIYFANTDWPTNNVMYGKYKRIKSDSIASSFLDGKIRWIMNDFDFGLGATADYNSFSFDRLAREYVFSKLLKNKFFKERFKERFYYQMKTTFATENVVNVIAQFENKMSDEIENHFLRWGFTDGLTDWKIEVAKMKHFATNRNTLLNKHFEKFINAN